MTAVAVFAVAGMITYLLRSSMVVFGDRLTSSKSADSAIALVSPAVLTAIIASAVLLDHGALARPDIAAVFSLTGAVIAVRRTSNVSMALAIGLPIYWVVNITITVTG